jgi:ATP-binding cassette, subfamily B, bacterial
MSSEQSGAMRNALPAVAAAWRAAPRLVAGHVVTSVASGLLPIASVWLLKVVIDALTGADRAALLPASVGLVTVGLLAVTLPAAVTFLNQEMERAVGRRALSDLYLSMARCQGLARMEDPRFRDRMQLAKQSGRVGPGQAVHGVIGMVSGLITLVGLVAVLTSISPWAAVVAVAVMVPALLAELALSRARTRMMFRTSPTERREHFYADLQASIPAAKEMRLLGLFGYFRRRMLDELAVSDVQRRRMDGRDLGTQLGLGAVLAVVLGGGIVWAIGAAAAGELSVGGVSAFVAALTALQAGLSMLVARVAMLHHSLLLYGNFRDVLAVEPDLPQAADPLPVPALREGIELRDVWFRYDPHQDWILRGVDLVIPHGTAVALVGLNGSGKSTLVKLLCRLYDPQRGRILWDGVDLRELAVDELRARIGVLFQDYMAYDLTAAENIGLGDLAAAGDGSRIRTAADRAGIGAAIERMPRGYDTLLSRLFRPVQVVGGGDEEAGVLLSGGQWQRLALARTFLRDQRDLLILDEPSSGLDAEAEHEIHEGLRRHRDGATSLLISHRLGAVRDADRIVVLDGGVIVEHGTHPELLAAGGEYARLFEMQAHAYQPDTADAAAPA